jgi:hypothetical protein
VVPPQTPEDSAVVSDVEVEQGVIQDGFMFTPPGSAGEVFAELRWGERVILPEGDSDRRLVPATSDPAPINYQSPSVPQTLTLRAWAPDAEYQHRVTARVDAVRSERANPLERLLELLSQAQPRVTRPERSEAAQELSGTDEDT